MALKSRDVYILSMLVLISCICMSIFLSKYTDKSDFPVFYYAASTIIDLGTPSEAVYNKDTENKYNIPENRQAYSDFIYSMPAAYVMTPLALIPYYAAKSALILLNILMYLGGVAIVLRLCGTTGRSFVYPLAFSFLWMPYIQNLRFGQINAVIFFLVSVAAFSATKNRPVLCGVFLGFAALFKLFPLAIAMVLGLKNWRIFVSCIFAIAISFLVPGSLGWLQAIGKICPNYTPIYLWFNQISHIGFFWYAGCIAGVTAVVVYRAKQASILLIVSFAIPAIFLTMPIMEYHYLTLIIFSYAFWVGSFPILRKSMTIPMLASMVMISLPFQGNESFLIINGLFVSWVVLGLQLMFPSTDFDGMSSETFNSPEFGKSIV